jgi:hypothetical protein
MHADGSVTKLARAEVRDFGARVVRLADAVAVFVDADVRRVLDDGEDAETRRAFGLRDSAADRGAHAERVEDRDASAEKLQVDGDRRLNLRSRGASCATGLVLQLGELRATSAATLDLFRRADRLASCHAK